MFCGAHVGEDGGWQSGVRLRNANIKINWMSHVARNDDDVKLNRLKMSIVKFIWAKNQWETLKWDRISDELNRCRVTVCLLWNVRAPSLPSFLRFIFNWKCLSPCEPTTLKQFGFIFFAVHFDAFFYSLFPFFVGVCAFRLSYTGYGFESIRMAWNYHNLTIGNHGITLRQRHFIFILKTERNNWAQYELPIGQRLILDSKLIKNDEKFNQNTASHFTRHRF